jgi:hypothetical protein
VDDGETPMAGGGRTPDERPGGAGECSRTPSFGGTGGAMFPPSMSPQSGSGMTPPPDGSGMTPPMMPPGGSGMMPPPGCVRLATWRKRPGPRRSSRFVFRDPSDGACAIELRRTSAGAQRRSPTLVPSTSERCGTRARRSKHEQDLPEPPGPARQRSLMPEKRRQQFRHEWMVPAYGGFWRCRFLPVLVKHE